MLNFGILGINARNLHYIRKHNPAKRIRLADNKITTKKFLSERSIPVPTTYGIIKDRKELMQFDFSTIPASQFIIKPARWSRGRGVFCVKKVKHHEPTLLLETWFAEVMWWKKWLWWYTDPEKSETISQRFEVDGKIISDRLLKTYCVDILEWKESLHEQPDQILIEELLTWGHWFETFCTHGLADIRIIVYNFVPVAAMVRVPTELSWGKANLDRWGVWLGVEVGSWKVQSMFLKWWVYKKEFPDPYRWLQGIRISYREDILHWSAQIQYYVNLGYLALDRVITSTGPKLLEINARAWLKIQLALDLPLRKRLEKIGDIKVQSPEKGVEICQTLFSQHKTWLISEKKVIPLHGYATLYWDDGKHYEVTVTIDMSKKGVSFGWWLWKQPDIKKSKQRTLKYLSSESRVVFTKYKIDHTLEQYHVVLWIDSMNGLFIKPVPMIKKRIFSDSVIVDWEYESLRLLDAKLATIWSKLTLSTYLKPTNFLQEFDKFVSAHWQYNPVFLYAWPSSKKISRLQDELRYVHDEFASSLSLQSPLFVLFLEKIEELFVKLRLLQAYATQDFTKIMDEQEAYWWSMHDEYVQEAVHAVSVKDEDKEILWWILSRAQVKKYVTRYLQWRGYSDVGIVFTPETYARMMVKKIWWRVTIYISSWAFFRKYELFATLAHELMHIERYMQWKATDRQILKRGTAKYFIDEEWLAIWASEQELPEAYEKMSMWKKYFRIETARRYDFKEVAHLLYEAEKRTRWWVFKTAYRLKRGICETWVCHEDAVCLQDSIYLHGYKRISNWIATWNDISVLKRGKIKIDDLCYF